MKRYWILALLIGALTTGCVKQQVALSPENAGKVASSAVILVVGQEELEAEIEQSNMAGAMGGGLLFALADVAINNSRSKSAEERVSPLRSKLSAIDFRKELKEELQSKLNGSWLHITKVETTSALSSAERKKIFDNRAENAVLIIDATYKLTSDFKQLHTSATGELFLVDSKEPIYKNRFAITSSSVIAKSEDQAVTAWSENNGSLLKNAIQQGIEKLADSIVKDVNPKTETASTKLKSVN